MRAFVTLALAFFTISCLATADDEWSWNLPPGFPIPYVPDDNPMSAAKVELGRHLFYDTRLSVNGKQSCASCHKQELAFTDGRATGLGATGESHTRGAMSLVNVAYAGRLTWNNAELRDLEEQALIPMYGEHPVELGLRKDDGLVARLRNDPKYQKLFGAAYPEEKDPWNVKNVTRAIASFERTIIAASSPYDRYHYQREDDAVSETAKRGEVLFFDRHFECAQCHGGFNFSDATVSARNPDADIELHNTGVSAGPDKFRAPSLRNITLTAPYMHDGSIATLEGVLDHYASGGKPNPGKDPRVKGFHMTARDKEELIAFLQTLTDTEVTHDPKFSNPWK